VGHRLSIIGSRLGIFSRLNKSFFVSISGNNETKFLLVSWDWSRQPVFPADNSGLGGGGRIAKSLMRTQRFNRLDQKERVG